MSTAASIVKTCRKKGLMLATAESCTGGLVAAAITDVAGASSMFRYGYVTYHNKAKTKLLGVPKKLLKKHGAVSAEVASAMAKGALKKSGADVAVSVTGIAGPTGGSKEKPVGLVYIAVAKGKKIAVKRYLFKGNRTRIRAQSVASALKQITSYF